MDRYSVIELLGKVTLQTSNRTYVKVSYKDNKTNKQHISVLDLGLKDDCSLDRINRYLNKSYLFRSISPRSVVIVGLDGEQNEVDHRFAIFKTLEDLAFGLYRKSNSVNNFHEGCYGVQLNFSNGYIQEACLLDLIDEGKQYTNIARFQIEDGSSYLLLDRVEFKLKRYGFFVENKAYFTVCGGFITSLVLHER